jgi:hypothetical protein
MADATAEHLDWSDKQRRILSANGNAERLYCSERGFPFVEAELPHFFLLQTTGAQNAERATHRVFLQWKAENEAQSNDPSPIVGAWTRPLFYGGWEHSTDREEHVFNVQTKTLFVDLRIPRTRDAIFADRMHSIHSLSDLTSEELRWYARQHIFAGYSLVRSARDNTAIVPLFDWCCTRHHCIDWNFVGVPRPRPNKWWIETNPNCDTTWKEWAFAADERSQHYYCERWESLDKKRSPTLALRKMSGCDGVIVVVGDHFNCCLDRSIPLGDFENLARGATSLVTAVDEAVRRNDIDAARAWLSMRGGHGLVSRGWKLDHCIDFWREGSSLWSKADVLVKGESINDCTVCWSGDAWSVFECSLTCVAELRNLLTTNL